VELLLKAARRGDAQALWLLLSGPQPPPVDAWDPLTFRTPLMEAAGWGHVSVLQALLSRGASVDPRDREGRTALMIGASSGSAPIVELLLQKNPWVTAKDYNGWTALMHAAYGNHRGVLEALLAHPKVVRQARNNGGQTASDLTTCPILKGLLRVDGAGHMPPRTLSHTPMLPSPPRARSTTARDPPPARNGPLGPHAHPPAARPPALPADGPGGCRRILSSLPFLVPPFGWHMALMAPPSADVT
jgi:hypothetical protein